MASDPIPHPKVKPQLECGVIPEDDRDLSLGTIQRPAAWFIDNKTGKKFTIGEREYRGAVNWVNLNVPYSPVKPNMHWSDLCKMRRVPNGDDLIMDFARKRRDAIKLMASDPYYHGHVFWFWEEAEQCIKENQETLVLGGNGSTKTWFLAWWGVKQLVERPNMTGAFFHSSDLSSVTIQQKMVNYFMPENWRNLKAKTRMNDELRQTEADTKFSEKNGFPNNNFILPNGSRGFFFNYGQEPGRQLVSHKFDFVVCDELVTLAHLEEIRFRLWDKKGKLVVGYTPVDGYTPAVRDMLAGFVVDEWRPSILLPNRKNINLPGAPTGKMPYRLKGRRKDSAIRCWFSEWNVFNDHEELATKLDGATPAIVKIRAYGWPENQTGVCLPKFGPANVIRRHPDFVGSSCGMVPPFPWNNLYQGRFPGQGKLVCVIDPADVKNWVIKWYYLSHKPSWTIVYREWPDYQTHGEWAIPGEKQDGVPGPAQRSCFGMGIVAYKKLILEGEGWTWDEKGGEWDGSKAEKVNERWMDSRLGGAEVPTEDKPTSLIQMMEEEQYDERKRLIGPAMYFQPAPGNKVKGGIEMLRDRFDYNVDEPVSVLNCPKWYVLEDCRQSVYCYREYTGLDGEKGALKDIIDPDRYLVEVDTEYIDPQLVTALERKASGF